MQQVDDSIFHTKAQPIRQLHLAAYQVSQVGENNLSHHLHWVGGSSHWPEEVELHGMCCLRNWIHTLGLGQGFFHRSGTLYRLSVTFKMCSIPQN